MRWEPLNNPSKIRSILGLAGYYRKFVEDFSIIATLLTKLIGKTKKFCWTEKQQQAFQWLKQTLCEAPILVLPKTKKILQFVQMILEWELVLFVCNEVE